MSALAIASTATDGAAAGGDAPLAVARGLRVTLAERAGGPVARRLPALQRPSATGDGEVAHRWHWQHGPIDLILGADGEPERVAEGLQRAWQRFDGLLAELVAELPLLRQPLRPREVRPLRDALGPHGALRGPVARRMAEACAPLAEAGRFLTPMAAVAGAVAEAVLQPLQAAGLRRAWVNNGGDVAWHLAPGSWLQVGVASDVPVAVAADAPVGGGAGSQAAVQADLQAGFTVQAHEAARGCATSGWSGRSFSLGIADRVTVLAASAAEADALATVVANAVNVDHPGIRRCPACEIRDDSDLGELPVTVAVPALPLDSVNAALSAGYAEALRQQRAGRLHAALLHCQGRSLRLEPPMAVQACTKAAQVDAPESARPGRAVGSVFAT